MEKDKITLQEFATLLAEKSGFSKSVAESFCKELFAVAERVLLIGDSLKISGLGTFKTQFVEPRRSVNIGTGEEMLVEGHNKIVFLPEKSLKELVNQPFAHLSPIELEDGDEMLLDLDKNKIDLADKENFSAESPEEPLKVLEEQAVEIKNILAEISGMSIVESTVENVSGVSENAQETETPEIQPNNTENLAAHEEELQARKSSLVDGKYSPFYADKNSHSSKNQEVASNTKFYFDEENSEEAVSRKSGLWWKILLPILLLLLALLLLYMFVPAVKSKVQSVFNQIHTPIDTLFADNLQQDSILLVDSLRSDSTLQAAPTDSIAKSVTSAPTEQQSATQTPDYQKIKVTETISAGTTLAALARKYYGHHDLWVYIYEANKQLIKNPDNMEIGTKINVPEIDKSFIDLKNPETLKKARALEQKIRASLK
ncbi:hypothetical protein FACS189429_6770 [Bacteroidia bacterium]|nr:hypothetical protein FACS189429_6770 [Bacteroidia bacterium]